MVHRTEKGRELEADGNTVSTPGTAALTPVTADDDDNDEEADLLSSSDAMLYRAIAAACYYLQPDRPDIKLAVKEV